MKKGQMEIIGLVFIVLLITIGMLFYVKFSLNESESKKVYTRSGLATSTMSAVMKTTISEITCFGPYQIRGNDNYITIGTDLIEDCAKWHQSQESKYKCNNKHSCDYVEEIMTGFLKETLGVWNKNYQYTATLTDFNGKTTELIKISSQKGCPRTVDRDTSVPFPIRVEQTGFVENVIYICD